MGALEAGFLHTDITQGVEDEDDFPDEERAREIDAELLYSSYRDAVEFRRPVPIPESAWMPGTLAWENAMAVKMAADRAWTTPLRLLETLRRYATNGGEHA